MERFKKERTTNRPKKVDLSTIITMEHGFTHIEYLISISVLLVIVVFFTSTFIIITSEKEKNINQLMLQHSYDIGYQYLKTEVNRAHSFSVDSKYLYIYSDHSLSFHRSGNNYIRQINGTGIIIVFKFIDQLTIESLPNNRGIHIFGQLKKGEERLIFDDILLSKYGGDLIEESL